MSYNLFRFFFASFFLFVKKKAKNISLLFFVYVLKFAYIIYINPNVDKIKFLGGKKRELFIGDRYRHFKHKNGFV